MIADPDLDTRLDQVAARYRPGYRRIRSRDRARAREFCRSSRCECRNLRLFLACSRGTHGESGNADDATLIRRARTALRSVLRSGRRCVADRSRHARPSRRVAMASITDTATLSTASLAKSVATRSCSRKRAPYQNSIFTGHHISAPMRRPGHLARQTAFHFGRSASEARAIRQNLRLQRRPGADLAVAARVAK